MLLDLFCKAGGCTKGYQRAGFYVVGVDREPQPNYCGDEFVQADAFKYLRDHGQQLGLCYDAIHASPPCQSRSAYRRRGAGVGDGYPDLIAETRALMPAYTPYVIENIEAFADQLRDPITLCGSSFGLDIRRHRLFECSFPIMAPPCAHGWQTPRFPAATNREPNSRRTVEVGVWRIPLDVQRRAMGIDWMTLEELSEAIPPAYTEHIGRFLMRAVESAELAA